VKARLSLNVLAAQFPSHFLGPRNGEDTHSKIDRKRDQYLFYYHLAARRSSVPYCTILSVIWKDDTGQI
jgi:hypothetical protein